METKLEIDGDKARDRWRQSYRSTETEREIDGDRVRDHFKNRARSTERELEIDFKNRARDRRRES
jgi:hypothetical protein